MENRKAGIAVAVVALVAAVVLFIVLSGDDDSSKDTGGNAVITIKNGKPVGGVQDLTFSKGGKIHFTVDSDKAYEIHFHGYDIPKDVKAGGSVTFNVPATIEGVFEAEIEDTGTQIAEITVNP